MKRLILPATIALSAALLVSGCSSGPTVDTIEQAVQEGLAEQLGGAWTVTCPDSMEVQAGLTANCSATSDGGETVEVNITQNDDQGNISWEVPSDNLDVANLEDLVATQLAEQVGGEWTVTCPEDVPLEQGLTTDCEATSADGQSGTITVTQTDDQGNVSWEAS